MTEKEKLLYKMIWQLVSLLAFLLAIIIGLTCLLFFGIPDWNRLKLKTQSIDTVSIKVNASKKGWQAPDISLESDPLIKYGKELIANTSTYLGPSGKVMKISNGMNCQNCHLEAGTKIYGNNYSAVAATYPKFRARSGTEENLFKRINDCIERSLNGVALDKDNKEMKAMIAYINWVGKDVPKNESPPGTGLLELKYLSRPADPVAGKALYVSKCRVCHQEKGEGLPNTDKSGYIYPPLWGKNSYNIGAGLYRLSRFAGYIKANMPLGASHDNPQLTDEEAWDIAAYVNSQPRPQKDISKDWPDISKKPIDHPFGPFSDPFDEKQHKFGPYLDILQAKKASTQSKI